MDEQKRLHDSLNQNASLKEVQEYIREITNIRGFCSYPVEQEMLLLTEEVGELAKAVRKEKTNVGIDKNKVGNYDSIEGEIADIFFVLTSICNLLHIDLYDAFYEKERTNINRVWSK